MEKLAVEVAVKIQYLAFLKKWEKLYFSIQSLYPFINSNKLLKPYLESSCQLDFEIGITNEFSCRNNG